MFGSFGQQNQQQQQQPQQQAGTGGLFGGFGASTSNATQPAQQTGAGLFGQPSGTAGAGGLFGSTTNANQGGLFGASNAQNTQQLAGGLFGSTNNQPQQPQQQQQQQQQQQKQQQGAGGGLFGNTGQPAASGGGLFGNFGNQQTNGGLFGNTGATNTAANTAGGLFGSTTQNNQPGGLFGQSTAQNTQAQQQQGASVFGQAQNAPPYNAQGASFFGGQSTAAGGLFGAGSSTIGTSTLGASTFGAPQAPSGLFSSRATVVPAPSQGADPHAQFVAMAQKIEGVMSAWNASSPQCRFQHYFYNLVDPAQVNLYGRPANATNDALWEKAVRENLDPTCLVPVVAVGFDDLQQRVDAQTQQAAAHQQKLDELKARLAALSSRHALSNVARQQRAALAQTQLTHRLLRLAQHLHLLVPALRASALRPEEEALRGALEQLDEEIRGVAGAGSGGGGSGGMGMGRMRGRLNELWALVGAVNAARERDGGRDGGGARWAVVDEEGLKEIAQILMEQQAGLAHLTKILQKDLRDLAVIEGGEVREENAETLSGSMSGLTMGMRSSTIR